MPNQIVDCSGHVVTVDQAQVEILSAARVDVNPNDDVMIELRTKRNGFIAGARVIVNESEEFTLIPEEVFEVCLQIPGLVDADLASALSRATTYYSTVRQEVPAASGDDGAGSDDAGAAAGPSASKAKNPSKARTTAATATTPRPRATPAKGKAAAVDPRLVAALKLHALSGLLSPLLSGEITTLEELRTHESAEEVEESLARPHALGAEYQLSGPQRRGLDALLGMSADDLEAAMAESPVASPSKTPAAAHAATSSSRKLAAAVARYGSKAPKTKNGKAALSEGEGEVGTANRTPAHGPAWQDDLDRAGAPSDDDADESGGEPARAPYHGFAGKRKDLDLSDAPTLRALLGKSVVTTSASDLTQLLTVGRMAASAAGATAAVGVLTSSLSPSELVDILEGILMQAVASGALKYQGDVVQSPPLSDLRQVLRHATALSVAHAQDGSSGASVGKGASTGMSPEDLAQVAAAANHGPTSEKDRKIQAELAAAAQRVAQVVADPSSVSLLAKVSGAMQGSAKASDKVKIFSDVSNENALIASLLRASDVRLPRGMLRESTEGLVCQYWQEVRSGLFEAVRVLVREKGLLKDGADATALIEAIFEGKLEGGAISLDDLFFCYSPGPVRGASHACRTRCTLESSDGQRATCKL